MAYATLEQLKAELNITHTREDVILATKLEDAQAILERAYRRRFEATAEETRYVDYSPVAVKDGRALFVPWDVCRISQIVNGDGRIITADEYVTVPRLRSVSGGESLLPAVAEAWPWYAIQLKASTGLVWTYDESPEEAIAITGKFAFSETAPYVVRRATIRLAAWLYHQRDTMTDILAPTASKEGTTLMPSSLPEDVQAFMKGLRRVV